MIKLCWKSYKGNKYYFGERGEAYKNTVKKIDNYYYGFSSKARKQENCWRKFEHNKYYFNKKGHAYVDTVKLIEGEYFSFDNSGKLQISTWRDYKGHRYYFGKNAKAKKNGLVSMNGTKYYFDERARMLQDEWREIDGRQYYFGGLGNALTGWINLDHIWYYFEPDGAKTLSNNVGGYPLEDGHITEKRKAAYDQVLSVVNAITTNNMTSEQKLAACYYFMANKANFRYLTKGAFVGYNDWVYDWAADMLATRRGNCYSFAAAFALMARTIGYDCHVVVGQVTAIRGGYTPHGWTEINGRVYDPELQFQGGHNYYGVGYSSQYIKNNVY